MYQAEPFICWHDFFHSFWQVVSEEQYEVRCCIKIGDQCWHPIMHMQYNVYDRLDATGNSCLFGEKGFFENLAVVEKFVLLYDSFKDEYGPHIGLNHLNFLANTYFETQLYVPGVER